MNDEHTVVKNRPLVQNALKVLGQIADRIEAMGLPTRAGYLRGARTVMVTLVNEIDTLQQLLQVQNETLNMYKELVEHRNKQIRALGGETHEQ